MKKQTFMLPVTWEVSGVVPVEADSLEDAVLLFDADEHPLPNDSDYVDGSFRLTSEDVNEVRAMLLAINTPI